MKPSTMKHFRHFLIFALGSGLLFGCETVITTKLDTGPTLLSVDGWLTDQPGPQTIRLTQTANYFNNGPAPVASGATVTVTDNTGKIYAFTDPDNDGYYVWTPTAKDTLGRIGRTYKLSIQYGADAYTAQTKMNRVPPIDSLIFRKKKRNPFSKVEAYEAEFYGRDFAGAPDYYRMKYYRNGELQNKTNDLVAVQDASIFTNSGNTDGLQFIRPLRQAPNPDSLYNLNDVVKVEMLSITADTYLFLQELRQQLNNVGLFARPATNVPTNIIGTTGKTATGYFVASAIRSRTTKVTAENLRPDE